MIRLDGTLLQSDLKIITEQLHEISARQVRLEAERDDAPVMTVTDDIQEQFAKGVIGLQVHSVKGDPKWSVSWRNIYIKELK